MSAGWRPISEIGAEPFDQLVVEQIHYPGHFAGHLASRFPVVNIRPLILDSWSTGVRSRCAVEESEGDGALRRWCTSGSAIGSVRSITSNAANAADSRWMGWLNKDRMFDPLRFVALLKEVAVQVCATVIVKVTDAGNVPTSKTLTQYAPAF